MIDYNKLRVRIRLANLRNNYRVYKRLSDNVIPVIKSDAYGHGLLEVCRTLASEADTFAVGFVNEAAKLREFGCGNRVIALLGPIDEGDYDDLWKYGIVAIMSHQGQLDRLAQLAKSRGSLDIGIKIDSGMRRLGFRPEEVGGVIEFIKANPALNPVMLTSHLASADEPEKSADVAGQVEEFQGAVDAFRAAGFSIEANLANSAGSLGHPDCRHDSLRLGIALYGCNPFHGTEWADQGAGLMPAMEVSAPVMQVHPLGKGEGIHYGWTYVADADRTVAIVGAGYADNYSRGLSNKGYMNIHGHRAPILGRVCMQMTAVDVTDILSEGIQVVPGDRAWLLGGPGDAAITPEELAGWWGTITYEVFCLLGMNPREYS